jgi:hypothetical protein
VDGMAEKPGATDGATRWGSWSDPQQEEHSAHKPLGAEIQDEAAWSRA